MSQEREPGAGAGAAAGGQGRQGQQLGQIEQLCEIEYMESDADHDAAGLFGSGDDYDDDDDGGFDLSF